MIAIRSHFQELIDEIPGINNVHHWPNNQEYVSYRNWDARLKRIETYNLRKYKRSLTATSMGNYLNFCVLDMQTDNQVMVINKTQYRLISQYLKSERFNRPEAEKASGGTPA